MKRPAQPVPDAVRGPVPQRLAVPMAVAGPGPTMEAFRRRSFRSIEDEKDNREQADEGSRDDNVDEDADGDDKEDQTSS